MIQLPTNYQIRKLVWFEGYTGSFDLPSVLSAEENEEFTLLWWNITRTTHVPAAKNSLIADDRPSKVTGC